MDLLNITIPGDPIPKARVRVTHGHGYTPRRTVDAEQVVRAAAMAGYGLPTACAEPVGIDVVFYCATRRRTDGDNLTKLVTDALQCTKTNPRGVIVDDSQIEDWRIRVRRRVNGEPPRTQIRLYTLE